MKKIKQARLKISNVHVSSRGLGDDTVALSCELGDARYHVWLNPETMDPGDVVYKNPLVDDMKHPDYFHTRTLRPGSDFTDALIASMIDVYKLKNLLAKFEAEEKNEEAARVAKNEEERRVEQIKRAAGDLYDACKIALKAVCGWDSFNETAKVLAYAIKRAEEKVD